MPIDIGERFRALTEGLADLVAALNDGFGDALAGLLHLGDDIAAAQRKVEHQRIAGGLERRIDLLDAARNRIGELVAGIDHELGELLSAARHHVEDGRRLLREAVGDAVEADRHHVLQVGGDLGELIADVVGLEVQRGGEPVARLGDCFGGGGARAFQPLQEVAAALAELLDHVVAGVAEGARDVLAFLGQGHGNAARRVVDLLGDQLADLRNVVRQIEMHAVDGVADRLGLADEGVALAAQVLQQRTDAYFVVVVGVFERRHLVGDQRLELGGARERALDAVAHGGDFAPYRLADGDDGFTRDRLGLGEPHRHFRHRLRDQAHLLRAHGHVGEHIEEHHGCEIDRAEHREHRRGQAGRTERRLQIGKIEPAEREPADHPYAREHAREDVGCLSGTPLDGAQDVADRFLIVIGGGAPHRGCILHAPHFVIFVDFRRGRLLALVSTQTGPWGFRWHWIGGQSVRWCRRHLIFRRIVIPDMKCVLDRRKRRFRWILHLLRGVRHVGRRLASTLDKAAAGNLRPRHERV